MRWHGHRCRPAMPPLHRDSAIRNNVGCFVHQCPITLWVRGRAAAAVAHEARRMARKQPRSQLFVRLVAAALAEAARKTGIDPQKPTPSGGATPRGRARAQRATRRRPRPPIRRTPEPREHPRPRHTARPSSLRGPGHNTATPRRPTGAGMSGMPVHPAMIVNLWPRDVLSCDHKFTIVGPSRADRPAAAERRPRRNRHRRAPEPTTTGPAPLPPSPPLFSEDHPLPGRPTRPPSRPEPPRLGAPPPAGTRPVGRGTSPRRPRRCLPVGQPDARQRGRGCTADSRCAARPPIGAGLIQRF
ncbi:hypothetical protein EKD16_17770 [Streptomonospora litoralis]|uniref:Uncharacterized protein n=1 Tax=Streptomonospora litoralis TaxID=2498135 RepID=A0A4V0ZK07_9ACTN|nr:hypothetical protein EKD16_17770 [Streptomonospora litoralis]